MENTLKVKIVDLHDLEPRGDYLEEGIVGIYIEEWNLDLKNIPYHIDKNNKFHIGIDGTYLDRPQKDGSVKEVFIPHFNFRNEDLWEQIKGGIQRTVLKQLDK